jgi:hypothetical protein
MAKRSLRPGDIVRIGLGEESANGVLLGAVPNVPRGQQIIRLANHCQELSGPKSFDALVTSLTELAKLFIVGWENVVDPFSLSDANGDRQPLAFSLDEIATPLAFEDLMEIMNIAVSTFIASADDKKKSESPHSSDAANSASPASVVVATL